MNDYLEAARNGWGRADLTEAETVQCAALIAIAERLDRLTWTAWLERYQEEHKRRLAAEAERDRLREQVDGQAWDDLTVERDQLAEQLKTVKRDLHKHLTGW